MTHTHAVTCICLTHRLAPEDGSILWDPLVVLVGQNHGQEERVLFCVCSHVVLMDFRKNKISIDKKWQLYKNNLGYIS